ncbi:MAG: NAD-dependent epimerase/dehydratase family protein [Deltaproteobacteria bacterium]|nr:NAD-dependent epimerase/dehydratase family protein [Deltaproteobacteria bacterium]
MKNIFITGVSGYIGGKTAKALAQRNDVHSIVGIDISAPNNSHKKLTFIKKDVRDPLTDLLKNHEIDSVVHTAYVLPPIHNKKLMENINVSGTENILSACIETNVSRLIYTSSATAYGFHPDNEVPLTEESALRGNDDLTYSMWWAPVLTTPCQTISKNRWFCSRKKQPPCSLCMKMILSGLSSSVSRRQSPVFSMSPVKGPWN